MATILKCSELPNYYECDASGEPTSDQYRSLKAEGYRWDVHCLNARHVTPGPLSDYYDGRDWCFRSRIYAERACDRANREAARRGDGLQFVVVDMCG